MKAMLDTETGEISATTPRAKEDRDFVKMYRQFVSQIADLSMQDVQALRVLLFLVRQMDSKNALVIPMSLIADMLGITRQTVSAKVKYLESEGWISIMRVGRQNVYIVNPDVFWTAYADQKSFCRFEAQVVLSSEDQWSIRRDDHATLKHVDRGVLRSLAEREFPETSPASSTPQRDDQLPGQMSFDLTGAIREG